MMKSSMPSWLSSWKLSVLLMVIVSIFFCFQMSRVFDEKLDLNGDNIVYFSLAQALHNGEGYTNICTLNPSPHTHFPPGYPAFMSILMDLGLDRVHQMKIVNCFLLLLSVLVLFVLIRKISGNVILSFVVCVLISAHAELLRWATIMMSEQLFLFTTLLSLFLCVSIDYEKILQRGSWKSRICLVALAIMVGYVYLVRSMGTSLVLGILIWMMVKGMIVVVKKRRKCEEWHNAALGYVAAVIVVSAGMFSTKAIWDARNRHVVPGYRSDYVGDFHKKINGGTMSTFSDWTERIKNNMTTYVTYYVPDALFEHQDSRPPESVAFWSWVLGVILLLAIVYGFYEIGDSGLLLLAYCIVTYGVLLVYPEQFAGIRYFVTLIPFLILGFVNAVYSLVRYGLNRLNMKNGIYVVPSIVILLLIFVMYPRYSAAQEQYRQMAKFKSWKSISDPSINQFITASEWAGENLPKDSRMLCRKPEIYYMSSNYHCASSFPQYAEPDRIMKLIDDNKIEYVLVDWWFKHAYTTLYPAIVANQDRFVLIKGWGEYNHDTGMMPTLLFAVKPKNSGGQ